MSEFRFEFFGSLERHALGRPEEVALRILSGTGRVEYTWRRLVNEIAALGEEIAKRGVEPGDRVALLMENHPAWAVAFAGIQSAGAVAVPLDTLSSTEALTGLVIHSEARLLIASEKLASTAEEIGRAAGIGILAGNAAWNEAVARKRANTALPLRPRSLDDELAILYTGGTTGLPKGVLLSQRNLYRSIADMLVVFPLSPEDHILSVLPLFHIMPLLANLLAPLYTGAKVTYLGHIHATAVAEAFASEDITAFLCVPQFYYQLKRRILGEVARQPWLRRWLFRRLLSLSDWLRRTLGIRIGKRLFGPVHAAFGTRLRAFGIGGASFDPETARFFASLGFSLFQAYGLTECGGLATATPLDRNGGFTCGPPVANTQVAIFQPDSSGMGEIVIRGENVMREYWRDPEATSEAIRDGWLHSGDLGVLSPAKRGRGALTLTGRAKEVIVLSSGKNIFPEELEQFFTANCPLIQEICVVGVDGPDGTRLHALVVPNVAAFREGQAFFVERPLWAEIESLARRLPSYKRPSGLHVLTEPLPRTTTRKLQRFRAAELARTLVASADRAPQVLGEPEHPDSPEREIAASIRRLRPAVGPISAGSSLELDLHLDSLERVELLANVERAFGITLPDERSASIYTFRDLADAVRAVSGPRRESADGWRNWKEILNQPFTSEETRFADAYLRPRPLLELFWFCVARAFRLGATVLLRLRVDAPHRLPQGGFLLCPNHVSYLDDVLAPGVLSLPVFRRVFFLGARKYFRNPLLAWLGRNMRVVPVDPDTNLLKALRMGKAGLERGMVLCVFPEGTRSFNGELQPLMKGPAVLASVLGAAVVPVGIAGTFEVLPRSAGFGGLHPVAISVGPPLAPVALDSPESFNERLRSELANAIGRARELRS